MSVSHDNPFARAGPPTRASSYLDEAAFAELYAATAFSDAFGAPLDTSVTITWGMLGATTASAVQEGFTAFLKCARDWLTKRYLTPRWTYVHEWGAARGLHTHFAIFVPDDQTVRGRRYRTDFRLWVRSWAAARYPVARGRAVRVRAPKTMTAWKGWLNLHYMLKGVNPHCVVQSSARTPDGAPLLLADLIAFPRKDPGFVPLRHQYGVSPSLNAAARRKGAPPDVGIGRRNVNILISSLEPSLKRGAGARPEDLEPFRSAYEDGVRDVRLLYPEDFVRKVGGDWSEPATQTESQPSAAAEPEQQDPVCQYEQLTDDAQGLSEFELAIKSLEQPDFGEWH